MRDALKYDELMGHDTRRRQGLSEIASPVLIISASGRALASSARRAGRAPWVLDLFADRDTCGLAAKCRRVPAAARGFDPAELSDAANALDPRCRAAIVYGSSLEACPELIDALAAGRRLIGNPADVVSRSKDPSWLAGRLSELGIPHPETRRRRPKREDGWLQKERGGGGGLHVGPARLGTQDPGAEIYFQRRIDGRVLGVTFLACRDRARIVGFAEQFVHRRDERRPFLYGGAVALAPERLPSALRTAVAESLSALAAAVGLRGLCGVDLIQDGERWWLIDLNPRPPASFELHEHEDSLLAAHFDAVEGRGLPPSRRSRRNLAGLKIVYADDPLQVPRAPQWPPWVCDRPWPGTRIERGEPVFSVRASAASGSATCALLESRIQRMQATLKTWQLEAQQSRRSA